MIVKDNCWCGNVIAIIMIIFVIMIMITIMDFVNNSLRNLSGTTNVSSEARLRG